MTGGLRPFAVAATILLPQPVAVLAQTAAPGAAAVPEAAKAATGGAAWDAIEGSFERGTHGATPCRTWLLYRRHGMRMESGEGAAAGARGFNGEAAWQARGGGARPSADRARPFSRRR